jgi:glycosyltransferase involved in cell wall biosynthesis
LQKFIGLSKIKDRKIVIVNQAPNYLTVGIANAFFTRFNSVTLICGSIHEQGEELNSGIDVHFINKWHDTSSLKKFSSYVIALCNIWFLLWTKYRKHEVFFISVPPMGYLLNLLVSNRFSMIIWDVYPDAFRILGMTERSRGYRLWAILNKYSFQRSYRLFTISERMADLLENYVSREKIIIQPIWSIFESQEKINSEDNIFIQQQNLKGKFIVQYSGNIGLSHNVEVLVEIAELLIDERDICFQIIGRGPRKGVLEKIVEEKKLSNCFFLPFQSDEMFPHSLSAANVGVVILDDRIGSGSVPSKSFNLMSLGIPSLYIASEESQLADYAKEYNHAVCYGKNDILKAAEYLLHLKNSTVDYNSMSINAQLASKNFTRKNAEKLVNLYLNEAISE